MALFSKQNKEALTNPLNLDHPILVQVLGICSALAVTSQLKPAIVMGLAVTVRPNIQYGLEIIKVNNGKIKDAGLPKGFIIRQVNDKPVKTVDELEQIVKEVSTSKDPVLIIKGVYPTGRKKTFVVELGE